MNFLHNVILATAIILLTSCSSLDDSQSSTSNKADEKFEIYAVPTSDKTTVANNLKLVSVFFNKAVEADSISIEQITITPPLTFEIDKSLLITRRTLFINIFEELVSNQEYVFEIKGIEELGSNQQQTFTWSYSTLSDADVIAPKMTGTFPANNATGVSDRVNKIQITFDEDVNLSNNNNFTISPSVPGQIQVVNNSIEFTPANSLVANQNYAVSLTGVNDSFGNDANDVSFSFNTGNDSTAPTSPSPLIASSITDSSVNLSWTQSTDISNFNAYQILRGTTALNLSVISTSNLTTFTDTTVNSSTTYFYQVIALDSTGNTSSSNLLSAFTLVAPDTEAPSTPGSLQATNITSTSISLQWNQSTDNVAVTGYNILKSVNGGNAALLTTTTNLTFTDNNVSSATNYQYQVIAFDEATNTSLAATVDATSLSPAPNSIPQAFADSFSVLFDTTFAGSVATNDQQSTDGGNIWSLVTAPANGSVSISSNGAITYTPNSGYSGADSFVYLITDIDGDTSNSATANITVQAQVNSSSTCSSYYAANALTLVTGFHNAASIPVTTKPVKGTEVVDPEYGTCMTRVTDHKNEPPRGGYSVNEYSRKQAFNADDSMILILDNSGFWHVYDGNDFSYIKELNGPAGDAEMQWHPTDPNILWYQATNGGIRVNQLDIAQNTATVLVDFTGRLPWSDVSRVWTRSYGEPSRDGRYWAFIAQTDSFVSRGFFVWDSQTDTIINIIDLAAEGLTGPHWISMSPTGRHVLVGWSGDVREVRSYTRDLTSFNQVHTNIEHDDVCLLENGNEAYVAIDYDTNGGPIFFVDLDTNVRTNLFNTYLGNTVTAVHFSCKAYNKPGWAVLSTYGNSGGPREWLHQKIFVVKLSSTPIIKNIAFHQTDLSGVGDYFEQPHASVNRDLTKILFNSNWNQPDPMDVDNYMIVLPSTALD